MQVKMFNNICSSIKELNQQMSSVHTVHQILFSLKDVLGISSAALVLKNQQTGYLEINNQYNLSAQYSQSYKRSTGKAAIGKIFLAENFIVVTKNDPQDIYNDVRMETDYAVAALIRLEAEDRPMGFIAVFFENEMEITKQMRDYLVAIANICSESIRKERLLSHLNELRRVDPKYGLLYYHFFHNKLIEEYNKSRRTKASLTICMMDMDNFKELTAIYGPETADDLYREMADELRASLRGIDILGRYGTDEIILYMPNTSLSNAELVINRFVERISLARFTDKRLQTSLSIGIAELKENEKLEDLLTRTKATLYSARVTGKGIVKISD
ncbi:GGDEF domain-containing protein [Candidatus Magnetomonas plexicatena]|uniref:GGDEF domain-containing protein n=1 Tax=Candidatus Magnetomonas plexicatena TaxID=2552947 RepID=UPI0011006F50|nr:diguanylate cyclase [Nitrospirales bacterium LBB_01]